ncbi:amidase family protein [Sphaerisporangium sp. TRM90804]|uniref:amidase family protein n=1 Tax=Sphaerisporangium sp. TRM90804 TaxID=3031113 RepID=UPI00244D5C68|nr:amidase family protein [Sphaerisporangium sp. TRM90804]MDH2427843.1 amidase family protein [Sphaerisporangium sp. TRM90804]
MEDAIDTRTHGRLFTPRRRAAALALALAAVAGASSPAAGAALTGTRAADRSVDVDLENATVAELDRLMDARKLTSTSLTAAYITRIKALNTSGPGLNAVRALNPAAMREAAAADAARRGRGPHGSLLGIPVIVKDNIDVKGMPTTAGSVALADSYPKADAPLVTGLRKAGAVILGKANLTEFANYLTNGMPSGYSSLGGQVLNAYDTSQTPSGSSSGSGVAASIGFAALTIGTETSGSILSPAYANSVVGIKPTVGLVSRTGIIPIAASQDTAGPMTRTVADAAAELTAITGVDPEDPATAANPLAGHDFTKDLSADALRGARIGVVASQVPAEGTDNRTLWDAAVAALRARGATLVDVTLDTSGPSSTVLSYEFKRDLNAYLARLPRNAPMKTIDDIVAYNQAHAREALKFGQTNALASQAKDISPGSADTARYQADRAADLAASKDRLDAVIQANDLGALLFANSGSAGIGARAGYPSINVPAGYQAANRRPFSIAFLGRAWTEPALIGYAYAYEQATKLRRPPSEINPAPYRCTIAAAPGPRRSYDSCAP